MQLRFSANTRTSLTRTVVRKRDGARGRNSVHRIEEDVGGAPIGARAAARLNARISHTSRALRPAARMYRWSHGLLVMRNPALRSSAFT